MTGKLKASALTLNVLQEAVAGSAAAFRCITEYQPAGGAGELARLDALAAMLNQARRRLYKVAQ